ncbi:hypothetical protein ACSBR2_009795 [Camellia fascicularis]
MLSALSGFPAIPSSDGLSAIQFPTFEGGFTPSDFPEPFFAFQQHEPAFFPRKPQEPVMSNSGSDHSNPKSVISSSGSDDPSHPNQNKTNSSSCPDDQNQPPGSDDPNHPNQNKTNSSSCPDDPNQPASVIDERKRRRMISNRESARRSRMRKQKHLENLRNQVNRLSVGNREMMNRLRLVTHHSQLVRRENERLRLESAMLREKLWAVHQVLLVRELRQ